MIKLKARTLIASADGCHSPGEIFLIDPEKAKPLLDGGYASIVKDTAETAVMKPDEKATIENPVSTRIFKPKKKGVK